MSRFFSEIATRFQSDMYLWNLPPRESEPRAQRCTVPRNITWRVGEASREARWLHRDRLLSFRGSTSGGCWRLSDTRLRGLQQRPGAPLERMIVWPCCCSTLLLRRRLGAPDFLKHSTTVPQQPLRSWPSRRTRRRCVAVTAQCGVRAATLVPGAEGNARRGINGRAEAEDGKSRLWHLSCRRRALGQGPKQR